MAQNINGYTIMKVIELLKVEKDQKAQIQFQDPNTRAIVYSIEGGKYILYPASGPLGLLIDNKETLDNILKTRIPIEPVKPTPFEKNINDIKALNSKKLIDDLFTKIHVQVNIDSPSTEDYKLIEKAVKIYPKDKRYDDLLVPLGFFIGECLLKKYPGEWTLSNAYSYNTYFIPFIKTKTLAQIDPFYKLTHKLLQIDGRKLDILECINNPFVVEDYYKSK